MSTAPARKSVLRLVPKPDGAIDADMVAFTIMEHIDTMFPAMWLSAPKTARVSVRNRIVQAVKAEEAMCWRRSTQHAAGRPEAGRDGST